MPLTLIPAIFFGILGCIIGISMIIIAIRSEQGISKIKIINGILLTIFSVLLYCFRYPITDWILSTFLK